MCTHPSTALSRTSNKQTELPSKALLWWLHITHLVIWCCQLLFPYILLDTYNTYCANTYFSGYDTRCSEQTLDSCYDDIYKCDLWDSYIGEYSDTFSCDCDECECVVDEIHYIISIVLFVFLEIGIALEFVRVCYACHVLGTNVDDHTLSIIADGIQLRCVQLLNSRKYKEQIIDIHYNQRTIFTVNGKRKTLCCNSEWHCADFVFHHFPVYVAVLIFSVKEYHFLVDEERIFVFVFVFIWISFVLYVINIMLTVRFGHLPPYIGPIEPSFAAPTLPQPGSAGTDIWVSVLNGYDGTECDGTLSITQDEKVKILNKEIKNGWILVANNDNKIGYVPFSFLEKEPDRGMAAGHDVQNVELLGEEMQELLVENEEDEVQQFFSLI